MKTTYTSLHDLKDIFCMIYKDCLDYTVKFWNFTDYCYMKLYFDHIDTTKGNNGIIIYFNAYSEKDNFNQPSNLHTVNDWNTFIEKIDDGSLDWDYAEIRVFNMDTKQYMKIYFTGSSNIDKQISYNIDYVNEEFHAWKRKWIWFKLKMRYRWNKLFNKI